MLNQETVSCNLHTRHILTSSLPVGSGVGTKSPARVIRVSSAANQLYEHYSATSHEEYENTLPTMPSPDWTRSAPWIWLPTHQEDESQPGRYFLFRKSFQWNQPHGLAEFPVHVSADSRYRLFVNGHRVSFGPCKSYPERWYYETVDILPFLVEGENVISARVLRYSCVHAGSSSIISTELPGFLVHGEIEVCGATLLQIYIAGRWLMFPRAFRFPPIHLGNV